MQKKKAKIKVDKKGRLYATIEVKDPNSEQEMFNAMEASFVELKKYAKKKGMKL